MVGIKLTRAGTGRESSWETEDLDDPVNQVHLLHDWLDRREHDRALRPVLKRRRQKQIARRAIAGLRDELSRADIVPLRGVLFRGIALPRYPEPAQFGPPPLQCRNRFNGAKQRALYLTRTEATLEAELSQGGSVAGYWKCRFEVATDLPTLALDPVSAKTSPRINQLLILAERPRSDGPLDPYVATIFLRKLCEEVGIQAIEYPSVAGGFAEDPSRLNVAVFTESSIEDVLRAKVRAPEYVVTDSPDPADFIGETVVVRIDRPLGTGHPEHGFLYPVNYGFLPGVASGDGEDLDVYVLGVFDPVDEFTGTCIAVLDRKDGDHKLIVVPLGKSYGDDQILALTEFQERWHESTVVRSRRAKA